MSIENIFGMAGGAMDAQSKRLALAVENIANADVLAGDQANAYKAKRVNFATILEHQVHSDNRRTAGGIRIDEVYEDDKVVPQAQAEEMVAALEEAQLPYGYILFEGEAHGFRKAESIERALEAELGFYGRVLGFVPAGEIEAPEVKHL